MWRKILKGISLLLVFSGVLIILGTAGASDFEHIEYYELLIRIIVGVIISLVGYLGLKIGGFENGTVKRGN